jgi:hypothetical protein
MSSDRVYRGGPAGPDLADNRLAWLLIQHLKRPGQDPRPMPDDPEPEIYGLMRSRPRRTRGHESRNRTHTTPSYVRLIFEGLIDWLEANSYRPRLKHDGSAMALCPLHDDRNPSLSLHPEKGYHCFGCQAGGKLSDLARRVGMRLAA